MTLKRFLIVVLEILLGLFLSIVCPFLVALLLRRFPVFGFEGFTVSNLVISGYVLVAMLVFTIDIVLSHNCDYFEDTFILWFKIFAYFLCLAMVVNESYIKANNGENMITLSLTSVVAVERLFSNIKAVLGKSSTSRAREAHNRELERQQIVQDVLSELNRQQEEAYTHTDPAE